MRKSIFTTQYAVFLRILRKARRDAGVSQVELARRLRTKQTTISKCERGERRLDVIELRNWCAALECSLADFIGDLERSLRS